MFPNAPAKDILVCFDKFSISDPECQVNIVAQMAEECGCFKRYVENLNYSAQGLANVWASRFSDGKGVPNELALSIARKPERIANIVYANRMGNGSESSGDGWKYRGRGAIQLTGKSNYIAIQEVLQKYDILEDGEDIVSNPDLLAKEPYNIYSAFAFLVKNNIHSIKDFKQMTKRINGGYTGLESRMAYREKLLSVVA